MIPLRRVVLWGIFLKKLAPTSPPPKNKLLPRHTGPFVTTTFPFFFNMKEHVDSDKISEGQIFN